VKTYHPRDVLVYNVEFRGPRAGAVRKVEVIWETHGAPRANRQGFRTKFRAAGEHYTAPPHDPAESHRAGGTNNHIFQASVTIPRRVVTGRYHVRINAELKHGMIVYGPDEVRTPAILIRNPRTFRKPRINRTFRKPRIKVYQVVREG
jgi:hypothetical protein